MTDLIASQIGPAVLKSVISIVVGGALTLAFWPLRKARKEWAELKKETVNIHSELVQQRTNCLTTLQAQGSTQIELLGKTVSALEGVRLDLAQQIGCLQALTAQPLRVRRRVSKK